MSIPMPLLWNLFFMSWPVLCVVAIIAFARWRMSQRWLKVLKYFGIVGSSIMLVCSLAIAWVVVFSASEEVSHSVEIPGYRVEFYESAGHMNFDVPRYFNIYRPDGTKAQFLIDIDAYSCRDISTESKEQRIYFYCKGEPLEQASYVDSKELTVYSGWFKKERAIADLEFVDDFLQN
ncbi:MAG: hypothetical protein AAGC93_22965 [Cyanobacteria bacterium P01_F01_bin.53]